MYQSEIRDSEKQELFEKVEGNKYGQYLKNVSIKKLRAFSDKSISFDFPVTALIGPNGGGKTTILGAAGLIHKDIKPKRFFAKNGAFDDSMQDWKVEYSIVNKSISPTNLITKTATYGSYKWSRTAIDRPISVFGISRTVPPSEKVEFSRYASSTFTVDQEFITKLEDNVAMAVGRILGKDVREYSQIKITPSGNVSFFSGKTPSGIDYSEFHFGAGESSVIRMITSIEGMPENSLILIEEIENGLHPIATQRMVEYLIDVAIRKKTQTIFTTHSNEALSPLPSKAIWVASNGELYQGKLDIKSLRAITGQIDAKLAIFVEDLFAKEWIESIIRNNGLELFDLLEVHGLEGDGTAVKINQSHNNDPATKSPSICYIDGDSEQTDNAEVKVFRLPGMSPEAYIYNLIIDKLGAVIGELTVSLHLKFEQQEFVSKNIKDISSTNRDPHLLFSQLGKKLGFISENVVRNAFLSTWNKYYEAESLDIFRTIKDEIPD